MPVVLPACITMPVILPACITMLVVLPACITMPVVLPACIIMPVVLPTCFLNGILENPGEIFCWWWLLTQEIITVWTFNLLSSKG